METLTLTTHALLNVAEKKRSASDFKFRREILMHVYLYLKYKYTDQDNDLTQAHRDALRLIGDRIDFEHHYTLGF